LPPTTSTSDAGVFLAEARAAVQGALAAWIPDIRRRYPGPVGEAIAYSLEGSGKRLRPALTLAAYQECGGAGEAAELAAAVEVVHTYSLVHDDLPCMDDDDLRRGRPTAHRVFGTAVATEAGFRMVSLAGRILAAGSARLGLDRARRSDVGQALFAAAGVRGMIGGQVLDLEAEGRDAGLDDLIGVHRAKTGAIITASVTIGGMAAGLADTGLAGLRGFGAEIGLAFQIIDDVLDVTGSSERLGKTAGKDARQRKASYSALLGVDRAVAAARARVAYGIDLLGAAGIDSKLLPGLARFVLNRRS
jgi:geranylgeranyl diphosphate synthase type II